MMYRDLVETYTAIESTTKRLEMTDHLVSLFSRAPPTLLPRVVYLLQGGVAPKYEGIRLGLAEKLIIEALHRATGLPARQVEDIFRRKGDIGLCAGQALQRKMQRTLFSEPMSVERVHDTMVKIARTSGPRSQETKLRMTCELLHDATPSEANYLARTLVGKLRIGVADMTILDALALTFGSKEDRPLIERAYNLTSDLGGVAATLASKGVDALRRIHPVVGHPVRPMLAERVVSVEEMFQRVGSPCIVEYKYDGMRIQAHISPDGVSLYSRRGDDVTGAFPDVVDAFRGAFRGSTAIVEGECVPIDERSGCILPFQEVSHRRGRKYGLEEALERVPVRIFLFDCIHADGRDLTDAPLSSRRDALFRLFEWGGAVERTHSLTASGRDRVDAFFSEAVSNHCEGIMAKRIDGVYQAGSRGFLWVKMKKDYMEGVADSFDLVIVGAFHGRGRRQGTYGGLLAATYSPEHDAFETICRLGSGFDDETLRDLPARLEPYILPAPHPRLRTRMKADIWLEPRVVIEVIASEITVSPSHTCAGTILGRGGLALRFPRFTGRWRSDRSPEDATTSAEVHEMYMRGLAGRSE